MKIAIFGATGKTGQQLTQQALELGHAVTVQARTPSKLTISHENLTVVAGDVMDRSSVGQTIAGQDAVICALGTASIGKTTVRSGGTANIIKAMQEHGASRLLVITALGLGESHKQMGMMGKFFVRTLLRNVMADHAVQEQHVIASGLDWTIVRPSGLTDDPQTGSYQHGLATDKSISGSRIARADVAHFTLAQLESEQYVGQAVTIT